MKTMAARIVCLLSAATAAVVAGGSFLAQPARFLAADVPMAQLVSVGSVIFHVSHQVQCVLLLALMAGLAAARLRLLAPWLLFGVACAALASQAALMPVFDERVLTLAAGHVLPARLLLHAAYIALEMLKVAALLALAWRASAATAFAHPQDHPSAQPV
jgi:hypothetical protein